MPRGTFETNAVFFAIGVLTYLYPGFRGDALGGGWGRAGGDRAVAFVSDGGQVFLKNSSEALEIFVMIRARCARILAEGGAVPKTS